jgi:Co/Zn/Cd efflux system component
MFGDALIYGFSLYVVSRGALWKARAATLKGWIMLLFGLGVLVRAVYKMLVPELPHYATMAGVGVLALAGNTVCLWLLWRHRTEDRKVEDASPPTTTIARGRCTSEPIPVA